MFFEALSFVAFSNTIDSFSVFFFHIALRFPRDLGGGGWGCIRNRLIPISYMNGRYAFVCCFFEFVSQLVKNSVLLGLNLEKEG